MGEYRLQVRDMSLAELGRKRLNLAEHEIPGLMAARAEFGPISALQGSECQGISPPENDPDRQAQRDVVNIGSYNSLGILQHLQHPGPCGGRLSQRVEAHLSLARV